MSVNTSGSIFIGDQDVTLLPATDRDVSMVFQSYALFPHMSVIENVSYGLNFSNFDKEEIKDRAYQGLELVGLKAYGNRLPSELSGGQQQRVAVARALVLEPQVLLFDEPLSNLDAKLRRQVREEIREIQQNLGLTVVYVTHDRDLYEAPANRFVADFIGEANIIPCEIISIKNEIAKIDISGFTYNLSSRGMSVGSAKLAVRPTRLILNAKTGIKMSVEKATYVGSRMEYTLNADFGKLFAVSENVDTPLNIGQKTIVGLDPIGPVLLEDT